MAEKIDIKHWNEFDDNDAPEPEQIFWRQYLNILTNELSVRCTLYIDFNGNVNGDVN